MYTIAIHVCRFYSNILHRIDCIASGLFLRSQCSGAFNHKDNFHKCMALNNIVTLISANFPLENNPLAIWYIGM